MKPSLKVRRKNKILIQKCFHANTFSSRFLGLMGKKELPPDCGLLLENCKQVHSFFMHFNLDIIFLDPKNTILDTQNLKTWRISKLHWKATRILETQEGFVARHRLKKGEALSISC